MFAAINTAVVSAALQSAVAAQNGRRRTRTLTATAIAQSAACLAPGEREFLHGGHVANCYGYAAIATIAVVWRDQDGRAWGIVNTGNATKGSTGFGRRDLWTAPAQPQTVRNCVAID